MDNPLAQRVSGSSPWPPGDLYSTLHRFDSTVIVIPSADHTHIRSGQFTHIYAVGGEDEWHWDSGPLESVRPHL